MPDHQGLPVAGYKPTQTQEAVDAVNRLKVLEERVLRELDSLKGRNPIEHDPRMAALALTHIQLGFMCAARAIFQPTGSRIELPEDTHF